MSDQLPLVEGTQKRELSQWFTPAELALRIVDWALQPYASPVWAAGIRVLEPSAGNGALARVLRSKQRVDDDITCIELDPENVADLKRQGFRDVYEGDFLDFDPKYGGGYTLAVMNPPFEGGQTERHIMHALKFADRVVCHCPLTTLEGKARRENLWSKVHLHRLAICSSRPKYGAGSGATAMCTIDVTLRDPRESRDATDIDWWP